MANARPRVPGQLWRTGVGAPGAGLGGEGEMYRDLASGLDYQKIGGAWGQIIQPNLPATKITGQLVDSQIASIAGSKITGTIGGGSVPAQPSCRVYRNGGYNFAGPGWVPILFDTEFWDTDTMHDNTTNPSRITFKTAGIYLALAHLHFASMPAGNTYGLIAKNGSVTAGSSTGQIQFGPVPNTSEFRQHMDGIFSAAVNDYIEVYVYSDGGAGWIDAAAEGVTDFSAIRLSS